jgi:hypothetical protein
MNSFQPADYIVYFHSFDKRTDSFQISVAASCEMYVCDDVIFYLYLDITAACTLCSVIYFHDVEVFAAIKKTFRTKLGILIMAVFTACSAALSGMK